MKKEMKQMHPIRPVRSIRAAAVIVLSTILAMSISACSSESELTDIAGEYSYTGAPIPISISAAGIETFGSGPVTRSGAMKDTNVDPLDDDYNLISSIESEAEQPQPLTRTALDDGIYFRVLAYKNGTVSTDNFAGAADYITNGDVGLVTPADSNGTLKLSEGKYIFICYSYNKSEPIEDGFNGKSATAISVSHGVDFLTAKQEATVKADAKRTYTLPGFTFSHKCARVYLEMISDKGNIKQCSATLSNLNSASVQWEVGNDNLPDTETGGTAALSWSSLNAETVKSEAIYILPNATRTVTVSLSFTAGSVENNKTFELPNRVFSSGTSYKITAKPKENSISIEGLKFKVAAGNLIKKEDGSYQMQPTQGDYSYQALGGDYFNWGTIDPLDEKKNITDNEYVDVCTAKLGEKWRTPTQQEMMEFQNCSPRGVGSYAGTINGVANTVVKGYYFGIQPTNSDTPPPNQDNYVFLPFAGYRNYGSRSMSYEGSRGYYWSSTPYNSDAYNLRITTVGSIEGNANFYRLNGFPVRCITGK